MTKPKDKLPEKSNGSPRFSFRTIGPAIIIAAVVCGPGSILTSSKTGAQFGYSAIWVLVLACVLMIGMVTLATRVGVAFDRTPCGELASRYGRPVSVIVGIAMFVIIACFQSSNNIAIIASFETFGAKIDSPLLSIVVLLIANATVILFLYTSRKKYRVIENAMKLLVLVMIIAFVTNCIVAKPSFSGMAKGLIPTKPLGDSWVLVALIGTTFSVAGAFYQSYLAREKGWTLSDTGAGLFDSAIGIGMLGGISMMIMVTSAAVFFQVDPPVKLDSPQAVALQLEPLYGAWARYIFGIGIIAGALSSFLVNALIGGHIMSDGFGLGEKIDSPFTIHMTTAALVCGMIIAILAVSTGMSRVQLIIAAQALTVVAVPMLAFALVHLGIIKRLEDPKAIPLWVLGLGTAGFATTVLLSINTVLAIIRKLSEL